MAIYLSLFFIALASSPLQARAECNGCLDGPFWIFLSVLGISCLVSFSAVFYRLRKINNPTHEKFYKTLFHATIGPLVFIVLVFILIFMAVNGLGPFGD